MIARDGVSLRASIFSDRHSTIQTGRVHVSAILVTGFPGFLGSALLPGLLRRSADDNAICLVQRKYAELAKRREREIVAAHPSLNGRIRLVEGDISVHDLGLDGTRRLRETVSEIFHLAAVYDLNVPRDIGMKVNVEGTRNVLELADGCSRLERLHYVSTCYVSGRYDGTFREEDLDAGQRFRNYYEETKFLAEVEVQKLMGGGLPTTIYRPSIVVGDSETGATQKYDGPYYIIRFILRQPRLALMPVVGDPKAIRVNLVPRDFILQAIAYLSGLPGSKGRVYQLADPEPASVAELLDTIAAATGRRLLKVRVPLGLAKAAIDRVPGVYSVVKIPSTALDYFAHSTRYATTNAERDLEGTAITVPRISDYMDVLVRFVQENPSIASRAMV